ncbi:uncharacterized protein PHACADRAFT_197586 [Phanerochaete carnosa HHB-10118-sp]|uniref:Uncharacterized protein n=1 Tax=Phanerochaete carnosa (strain HHB-10118-sp) TaxID=650164 RepID=K5VNV5_PHACS|nr:uncharacterized protein PHACADRAFT_197586 [Phanerochaete carnosa HHB-10118-sp]EKM53158.1 hypothetical protein PHACADRAFT_197586 [Phanerochaete carnosa HHB-10118-sp]
MDTLHQWRYRLAQEAEEAVKTLISEDEYLDTKEKIKDFITYLLGDEAGRAPFVYKSWGGRTKQMVNRVLHFWKTGKFVKPTSRASHYSQDNWGNTSI